MPKIKISESADKISNPHHKRLYRFFDEQGKAVYDELYLADESPNCGEESANVQQKPCQPPSKVGATRKAQKYSELLVPIFKKGQLVYEAPSLLQTRDYARAQLERFIKSLKSPKNYELRLSANLQRLKKDLLEKAVR